MNIENVTASLGEQPLHLRYASLHRAVERGIASSEVLSELARVCLDLDLADEAVRIWQKMEDSAVKRALESQMKRRGIRATADGTAVRKVRNVELSKAEIPPLRSHLFDAVDYLLLSHMPFTVLVAILAFPLVVGVGGFLTAGGSALLLPAVAFLPGVCVLGIIGALAHRILENSSRGDERPPAIPEPRVLVRDSLRFAKDAFIVPAIMLGPAALLLAVGCTITSLLPVLLIGMFLLPLAFVLRQLRGDWEALSPNVLIAALRCCGLRYVGVVGMFWAMFAPAVGALLFASGAQPYLQISLVGPLAVVPVLAAARMLGTFVDSHVLELTPLLMRTVREELLAGEGAVRTTAVSKTTPVRAKAPKQPARPAPKAPARPAAPARPQPAPARPAQPTRPAQPARPAAPARPQPAPARPAQPTGLQPAPAQGTRQPQKRPAPPKQPAPQGQPRRPQPARHGPAPAPAPSRTRRPAPAPVPVTAETSDSDAPDLSCFPGATVLKGSDRDRFGASSNSQ